MCKSNGSCPGCPNAPTKAAEPEKQNRQIALCAHLLLFIEQYLEAPIVILRDDGAPAVACVTCGTWLTVAQFDAACEAAVKGGD